MKKAKKKQRRFIRDEEGLKLLAERLKEVRSEKGFTQEQLANDANLSLSQIARIETSRINPTVSTIFQIARTLNVNAGDLLNFKLPKK